MPPTISTPLPGGRAQAKENRRSAILQAAETLVRASGGTLFSVHALAAASGLSVATSYNLFGSKGAVLYALLHRQAAQLRHAVQASPAAAPLDSLKAGISLAVGMFTADPAFYRPLMRFLLAEPEPAHRPAFMAQGLDYWHLLASRLGAALPPGLQAEDIASALHTAFTGALDMWVHGERDEAMFEAEMIRCAALLLLACPKADKSALMAELARCRAVLGG